jgi:hypothetical protein
MGGACRTYGAEKRCIQGFVRKPEGRRPLERLRRRWEDNITMDLQEVRWGHGLGLFGSGYEKDVGCHECGDERSGCIKYGEFLE